MRPLPVEIRLPDWIAGAVDEGRRYEDDEARMRLVVELSRENVLRDTGGPFAAAVFDAETGRPVSVGVNVVVPQGSSVLHAEVVAILAAHRRLSSYTLRGPGMPDHALVASCDPCAMCLGAVLWSGARRLVCGAAREDAERIHFDEGPVFQASYDYLADRGIEVVRGVLREEASAVLDLYAERDGEVYNG